MKLWWLESIDIAGSPHKTHDCITFFVVRAADEENARKLAATQAKDETPECWLNPKWSICEEYTFPTAEGEPDIVWSEFYPG